MLLSQLISNQQSLYNQIQIEIERLQEKQREIQSYLQKLGSVESQMESAAALVQEAIASIRQECPDELSNYQALIDGFFGAAPIAVLNASVDDPQPDVEPSAPVEPTNDDVWASDDNTTIETIETTAVAIVDDIDYQDPEECLQEQKEEGESQPELDFTGLTWVQIKKLASSMGLDINRRKRPHLEKALTDSGITQAEIDQFLKG